MQLHTPSGSSNGDGRPPAVVPAAVPRRAGPRVPRHADPSAVESAVAGALAPRAAWARRVRATRPEPATKVIAATVERRERAASFRRLAPLVPRESGWRMLALGLPVVIVAAAGAWLASFVTPAPWLSPMLAAASAGALFLAVRPIGRSFVAALATLAWVASPAWLAVATGQPAVAMTAALAGLAATLRWWRTGGVAASVAAGGFTGLAWAVEPAAVGWGVPLVLTATLAWPPRRAVVGAARVGLPLLAAAAGVAVTAAVVAGDQAPDYLRDLAMASRLAWPDDVPALLLVGGGGLLAMAARRPRVGVVLAAWLGLAWCGGSTVATPVALVGVAFVGWRALFADGRGGRWHGIVAAAVAGLATAAVVVPNARSLAMADGWESWVEAVEDRERAAFFGPLMGPGRVLTTGHGWRRVEGELHRAGRDVSGARVVARWGDRDGRERLLVEVGSGD